jgi:hypothetical protein
VVRTCLLTMERLVGPRVSNPVAAAVAKVAIDQLVFLPPLCGVLLALIGGMQGKSAQQVQHKLQREYKDVLFSYWKVRL